MKVIMRIVNNIDNGNLGAENRHDTLHYIGDSKENLQTKNLQNQIHSEVDNYHFRTNINQNTHNDDSVILNNDYRSLDIPRDTAVCNRQYKLNNRIFKPDITIEGELTNSLENKLFTDNTNDSYNIISVDEEQPFYDQSDTEEMSEDSIHPVLRGIVNPNYPGFQHLAHTLQEYSSNIENFYHSENEMTDDDIDTEISDLEVKGEVNENYKELNNNKSETHLNQNEKSFIIPHVNDNSNETIPRNDIPDLLKTISSNNNNDDLINCDITSLGTEIENNFNTKDIIGDFNKEVEDEIKQLLNYNINIQEDLDGLRKDIKDNFEKPIETTINNISEVVNHVIKKLVKSDICDEINNSSATDRIGGNIKKQPTNMKETNERNVRMEINLSRPTFLLLENSNDQFITDAVLSDGKEEININEDEYDTDKLSNNVESTIKQLSTELRKIIPKLNEMRERDKLWSDRPIITDGNSNRILTNSSKWSNTTKDLRNRSHYENYKQINKSSYHRVLKKISDKAQNETTDPSKYNAQYNTSVPRDNIVTDSDFESFDVYNIETALPKLDIDTIENYIKAAKDAERRKRNDREEIRKRLAMGIDSDEYYSLGHTDRPGKKPSLHSRLQNGKNLQICFMNETASDNESQCSDMERSFSSNSKSLSRSSIFSKSSYNHPYQTRPLSVNITKQDKINSVQSGFKLHPASLISKSTKSRSTQSLNHIELKESDFYALQATLQTEARIALAQAKELARIQMEHERRSRPASPVTEMLRRSMEKANVPLAPDRRRVSRQILTDMNIAQLQVIVNELHSQIECLNDTLVKMLMARDELHMGQDSMLVDIEDLTRYLGVKEQSKKSKGGATKSGVRRLTSLVHK